MAQTAIVTGAGSGLGMETTKAFLAAHDFADPERVGCMGALVRALKTQKIKAPAKKRTPPISGIRQDPPTWLVEEGTGGAV